MSNNSLIRSAEKSLEVKSLKDLVRARTSEHVVLLVDVSISMGETMRNGKTRIEGLRIVVAGMQAKRATQMIAFGLRPELNPEAQFLPVEQQGKQVGFVTEIPSAQGDRKSTRLNSSHMS